MAQPHNQFGEERISEKIYSTLEAYKSHILSLIFTVHLTTFIYTLIYPDPCVSIITITLSALFYIMLDKDFKSYWLINVYLRVFKYWSIFVFMAVQTFINASLLKMGYGIFVFYIFLDMGRTYFYENLRYTYTDVMLDKRQRLYLEFEYVLQWLKEDKRRPGYKRRAEPDCEERLGQRIKFFRAHGNVNMGEYDTMQRVFDVFSGREGAIAQDIKEDDNEYVFEVEDKKSEEPAESDYESMGRSFVGEPETDSLMYEYGGDSSHTFDLNDLEENAPVEGESNENAEDDISIRDHLYLNNDNNNDSGYDSDRNIEEDFYNNTGEDNNEQEQPSNNMTNQPININNNLGIERSVRMTHEEAERATPTTENSRYINMPIEEQEEAFITENNYHSPLNTLRENQIGDNQMTPSNLETNRYTNERMERGHQGIESTSIDHRNIQNINEPIERDHQGIESTSIDHRNIHNTNDGMERDHQERLNTSIGYRNIQNINEPIERDHQERESTSIDHRNIQNNIDEPIERNHQERLNTSIGYRNIQNNIDEPIERDHQERESTINVNREFQNINDIDSTSNQDVITGDVNEASFTNTRPIDSETLDSVPSDSDTYTQSNEVDSSYLHNTPVDETNEVRRRKTNQEVNERVMRLVYSLQNKLNTDNENINNENINNESTTDIISEIEDITDINNEIEDRADYNSNTNNNTQPTLHNNHRYFRDRRDELRENLAVRDNRSAYFLNQSENDNSINQGEPNIAEDINSDDLEDVARRIIHEGQPFTPTDQPIHPSTNRPRAPHNSPDKEITNKEEKYIQKLINSMKHEEKGDYIELQTLNRYFKKDHTIKMIYSILSKHRERIYFEKFQEIYKQFIKERKSLYDSFKNIDALFKSLHVLLIALEGCLFIYVIMVALQIKIQFMSMLLSLIIFLTLPSIKHTCESFSFLLVNHPFDAGDRVHWREENLIVKKIDLFYTMFEKWNGEIIIINNYALGKSVIHNIKRSARQKWKLTFLVNKKNGNEMIKIERMFKFYVKSMSREVSSVIFSINSIENVFHIKYDIFVTHTDNFQNGYFMWRVHSAYMKVLMRLLKKCKVDYYMVKKNFAHVVA